MTKAKKQTKRRRGQSASKAMLELRAALDRSAYALFQIKRMTPESIRQFASEEHEKACEVLNKF